MDDAKVLSAALKLPVRKREKVAEALLASIKSPSQRHVDQLWAQEAESRIEALLGGKLKTLKGEKVLQYKTRN